MEQSVTVTAKFQKRKKHFTERYHAFSIPGVVQFSKQITLNLKYNCLILKIDFIGQILKLVSFLVIF